MLNINGDDVTDMLIDIERSFGIAFPRDLTHVLTAGDLHRAIMDETTEPHGTFCGTSHVFYELRRAFDGTKPGLDASLAALCVGSPAAARRALIARTSWDIPSPPMRWFSCTTLCVALLASIATGWFVSGWLIAPILVLGWLVIRSDRGTWTGDWSTLASLSRAVSARNYQRLAAAGARHSPATVWQALLTFLDQYAVTGDRAEIARETRFFA